jgi:HIRAN domain.
VNALPDMSLAVVGARHKNADGSSREAEIEVCEPGEPVFLLPEPDNEFDRHAIAVFSCRDVQIGYVSAERAPRIGTLIGANDVVAVFQRPGDGCAWIRVSFDGRTPVLTDAMILGPAEAAEKIGAEPDFYPDEVWPDD